MKALLIGYGKMGKLISEHAPNFSIKIESIVSPNLKKNELLTSHIYNSLSEEALSQVDVVIDFSSPQGIKERVSTIMKAEVPLVIGTTGWDKDLKEVQEIVSSNNGACIHSANFSLGVLLFFKLIENSANIFNIFSNEYDCAVFEAHHREKKDSPSGTAKKIANILLSNIEAKTKITTDPEIRDSDAISVTSMRCGNISGEHSVIFDSNDDTISLSHYAKNRSGFAKGALQAAKWVVKKKGCFGINDFLEDILKSSYEV